MPAIEEKVMSICDEALVVHVRDWDGEPKPNLIVVWDDELYKKLKQSH